MSTADQKARVLRALQSGRPITIGDFEGFPTCDGKPPIKRLAARIYDLKQDGYPIRRMMTTLGNASVAAYYLDKSSSRASGVATSPTGVMEAPAGGKASPAPAGERVRPAVSETHRCGAATPASPARRTPPTPPTRATPTPAPPTPVAAPRPNGTAGRVAPQPALFPDTPAADAANPYAQEAA